MATTSKVTTTRLSPTVALVCLLLCGVATAVPAAADPLVRGAQPCSDSSTTLSVCLLPADGGHSFDSRDGVYGWQFGERWHLGARRDARKRFGLVREGERSDFAITEKGLRVTFKF